MIHHDPSIFLIEVYVIYIHLLHIPYLQLAVFVCIKKSGSKFKGQSLNRPGVAAVAIWLSWILEKMMIHQWIWRCSPQFSDPAKKLLTFLWSFQFDHVHLLPPVQALLKSAPFCGFPCPFYLKSTHWK